MMYLAILHVVLLPDCTDDSIRLVDGDNYNATAGRVEYCVGGRWGTVCNYLWSEADAIVVCQQLGLNTFSKTIHSVKQINGDIGCLISVGGTLPMMYVKMLEGLTH